MKIKEEYICPKCKHKNRIKIYEVVEKDNIKKIIDRSLFYYECKKCHEKVSLEYPLKVRGYNYQIYYTPGKNDDIDEDNFPINRICDTYSDLKEKVLILEDKLNDIVIEELKNQIKKKLEYLDISDIESLETIRYNSIDESNLNFSLVGIGKLVGISITEYKNLEDGIKTKKIKKSVLIDEYTYKKYIRRCTYEIASKKRIGFFKW